LFADVVSWLLFSTLILSLPSGIRKMTTQGQKAMDTIAKVTIFSILPMILFLV
jgi:ABC-type transport system involved in Fe-S cluster assembly fused permease/ATPase subunit